MTRNPPQEPTPQQLDVIIRHHPDGPFEHFILLLFTSGCEPVAGSRFGE